MADRDVPLKGGMEGRMGRWSRLKQRGGAEDREQAEADRLLQRRLAGIDAEAQAEAEAAYEAAPAAALAMLEGEVPHDAAAPVDRTLGYGRPRLSGGGRFFVPETFDVVRSWLISRCRATSEQARTNKVTH